MRVLSVETVADRLRGVTVLVRSSLNVPVIKGVVANKFRLDSAVKTISYLQTHGARVVVLSHINGGPHASLRPVYDYLKRSVSLQFVDDVIGPRAHEAVSHLKDGEALMLENLRWHPAEVENDPHFARQLASLGDIFVNDDFAAAHREHASVVGLPALMPSFAGLQFVAEIEGLSHALSPKSPSLALLGGAKFVTKEPLIRLLIEKYDRVFVGGALATDFFKAKGFEVGRSIHSGAIDVSDMLQNSKLMLPTDVTIEGVDGTAVKAPHEVLATDTIYDIGPKTLENLTPHIQKARTVLWNGPMGNFEKGYSARTEELARRIAAASGYSAVGGGDTIASIQKLGLNKKFEFLSTAGGAMLDFLAHGTLPGIEALEKARKLD